MARLKTTSPEQIAVSVVTRMEIEFGLLLNPERAKKRAALQKRGLPIGPYDVLIAGCGLARGLTVVTANVGEFQRVSGLLVENWR